MNRPAESMSEPRPRFTPSCAVWRTRVMQSYSSVRIFPKFLRKAIASEYFAVAVSLAFTKLPRPVQNKSEPLQCQSLRKQFRTLKALQLLVPRDASRLAGRRGRAREGY